jgi:serine/threonine protein phosphatase 1
MSAVVAIGDIHGELRALDDLLTRLQPTLAAGDAVVFLGDYIDRGAESRACIDRLLRFEAEAGADVVFLLGNHEDAMLRTMNDPSRHTWLFMQALPTIASYSPTAAEAIAEAAEAAGPRLVLERVALPYETFFGAMPDEHCKFFGRLQLLHRSGDAVFVHGGVDPSVEGVDAQSRRELLWGTPTFPERYRGAETIVYGHWNDAALDADLWPHPAVGTRTVGIDTIAHGVLTAFRWPDRTVLQSQRTRP